MKTSPFSLPNLPAPSEYALIVGAGAAAAASIVTQQAVVASLPLTTLVALGLVNRHRLDRHLQSSQAPDPGPEHQQARAASVKQVSSRPMPEAAPPAPVRFSRTRLLPEADPDEQLRQRQRTSLQTIGAQLQQARQQQALSLQQIHQQTFIQPYTLTALETGNLRQLPEPFYIRAFIQKYAHALGLPGAQLAAEFPTA